jgi:hypothetical protein
MVKGVEQICATCEFYGYYRFDTFSCICTLNPGSVEESIVEPTDSCDQWLAIQPRKTLNDAKPEEWDAAVAKLGKKSHV